MQILVAQIHQTVGSRQDLDQQTGFWVQHYLLGRWIKIIQEFKNENFNETMREKVDMETQRHNQYKTGSMAISLCCFQEIKQVM